jgi:hypothetical protein
MILLQDIHENRLGNLYQASDILQTENDFFKGMFMHDTKISK